MRAKIMMVLLVVVVIAFNYAIYEKEQIKEHGEIILLELTPTEDFWLVARDSIHLRYAIEKNLSAEKLSYEHKRGYIVIKPDENNVAEFIRFYKEEKLAPGEKLIRFYKKHDVINIMPNLFFFQEGHLNYYENARYSVFKFSDSLGKYLLVGLADENKEIISVE